MTNASQRAIRFHADAATDMFYAALRERRFRGTCCRVCAHVPFPPRAFCPHCGAEPVEWIDLPTRGTLHAFSQQHRSLRFARPDVIGLVLLPGVAGLVLTKVGAPLEALAVNQTVEVGFVELAPDLVVHEFHPA